MNLLLTSVFGPYAVDDEYGEKENRMELFHNQVTREQGIFSYRFNHGSQGLHLMAENVDVPTTVLDFPSQKRFIKEIKKGYDFVGISFIMPNFEKTKKMAELIRQYSPKSKIILGGHGVSIPNLENLIQHDYICKGEGVKFLRELFGENVNRPIKHPIEYSSFNRQVMGVPWAQDSGVLLTGVGCANKCRFCATSHFFGEYSSFLKTGRDIFNVCCEYQDKLGVTDFGVLDENFLKTKTRALELIDIMEKEDRYFSFAIFSSAETLKDLGDLDLMVRLGVRFIWIGVESKKDAYEKNNSADFHYLVAQLRKRGISVLASAIMFLEHHDKSSVWDDVDYAISLNPDYIQFMQLGPIPGTALYRDYEKKNLLIENIPYLSKHGQKKIWFKHPHFSREESEEYLTKAFVKDYTTNGASLTRAISTTMMGYQFCKNHPNKYVQRRAEEFKQNLKLMEYFLFSMSFFKENKATWNLVKTLRRNFRQEFGRKSLKSMAMTLLVFLFATKEWFRIRFITDVRKPQTFFKAYHQAEATPVKKIVGHKEHLELVLDS